MTKGETKNVIKGGRMNNSSSHNSNKNNNQSKLNKSKIIVMIPAYNEEKTIAKVIHEIPRSINNHTVEVLVINDGSTDNTVQVSKIQEAD